MYFLQLARTIFLLPIPFYSRSFRDQKMNTTGPNVSLTVENMADFLNSDRIDEIINIQSMQQTIGKE